jgi:hypothetical protein
LPIVEFPFSHYSSISANFILSSVELVCEKCFSGCESISPVAFEADSKTSRHGKGNFGFVDHFHGFVFGRML